MLLTFLFGILCLVLAILVQHYKHRKPKPLKEEVPTNVVMDAVMAHDAKLAKLKKDHLDAKVLFLKRATGYTGEVIDGKVFIGGLEVHTYYGEGNANLFYRSNYSGNYIRIKEVDKNMSYVWVNILTKADLGELFKKVYGKEVV